MWANRVERQFIPHPMAPERLVIFGEHTKMRRCPSKNRSGSCGAICRCGHVRLPLIKETVTLSIHHRGPTGVVGRPVEWWVVVAACFEWDDQTSTKVFQRCQFPTLPPTLYARQGGNLVVDCAVALIARFALETRGDGALAPVEGRALAAHVKRPVNAVRDP